MLKALILLTLIFFILALVQTSFLIHFMIFGIVLNASLLLVVLLSIFEPPQKNLGLYGAVISGFFLDVFSSRPFGFWIIIFLLIAVLVKLILKKHVRIPFAA